MGKAGLRAMKEACVTPKSHSLALCFMHAPVCEWAEDSYTCRHTAFAQLDVDSLLDGLSAMDC